MEAIMEKAMSSGITWIICLIGAIYFTIMLAMNVKEYRTTGAIIKRNERGEIYQNPTKVIIEDVCFMMIGYGGVVYILLLNVMLFTK